MQVELDGQNAYFVMGMTQRELRKVGLSQEELDKYFQEATSGDYNNLLEVTRLYIEEYGLEAITV